MRKHILVVAWVFLLGVGAKSIAADLKSLLQRPLPLLPAAPEAALVVSNARPTFYTQEAELGPAIAGQSGFGNAIAAWQDDATGTVWAIVGAPFENDNTGAAYVFSRASGEKVWHQEARLTASDAAAKDAFGSSVAIQGGLIAIGAPYHTVAGHDSSGEAYVFERIGADWVQQDYVTGAAGDHFYTGYAVAILGDDLFIGAFGALTHGAVWHAKRSGARWAYTAAIMPPAGVSDRSFGSALAAEGNRLLVGMPYDNGYRGTAFTYVYDGSSWNFEQKLEGYDVDALDDFGQAVALHGGNIAIGAPFHADNIGGVYPFVYDNGSHTWKAGVRLAPDDNRTGNDGDLLGMSVAISDNEIVAGGNNDEVFAYKPASSGSGWLATPIRLTSTQHSFGESIALAGDTLLVGAPLTYYRGTASGSVTPFAFDGSVWQEQSAFYPLNSAYGFASSVAISGSTAVASFPGKDVASIFTRDVSGRWSWQTDLPQASGPTSDAPPNVVVIDGDTVLLASPFSAVGANLSQGYAAVYQRSGAAWGTSAGFLGDSSGKSYDLFGYSVSLSGTTAAIGAPGADASAGCVYIFARNGNTWNLQQKLKASDASADNFFGAAVSIAGDRLVVGAPFVSGLVVEGGGSPPVTPGKAYIFERSGTSWSERKKLTASDGSVGDRFGEAVSVAGGTVAIGAPLKDGYKGAVYVFSGSGASWPLQQELVPSLRSFFGNVLGLSGNRLVIGNPGTESAMLFERSGASWAGRAIFSDDRSSSYFGSAVGISGSALILGAPGNDSRADIFQDDQIFADGFQ